MPGKIMGGLYQRDRTIEMCIVNRIRSSLHIELMKISQFYSWAIFKRTVSGNLFWL